MGRDSSIQWTDHTFNGWIGCTKVSPGCDNCYAETLMDKRFHHVEWGVGKPRRRTAPANWHQPLKWNREAAELGTRFRVFSNSLSDVFDTEVPDAWRVDLFDLIERTPNLDWLVLTKRPHVAGLWGRFPSNVRLGTTIENQEVCDHRIELLLLACERSSVPNFLSLEPLLGPVDLAPWADLLDWVIVGGESGHAHRMMRSTWAREVRDVCQAAGVPFFMKQMSAEHPEDYMIPGDLMIREVPQ